MNPRQQDFSGELDELELGERVADWLFTELAGSIYANVKDRVWEVVLHCYASVVWATGTPVPSGWMPALDSNGRWEMP